MSQKTIKTESLIETVVSCPKCHQKNRLSKRAGQGVYRCGNCQNHLCNPFIQSTSQTSSTMKVTRLLAMSILTGIGLLIFLSFVSIFSEGNRSPSPSLVPVASPLKTFPSPLSSPSSVPLTSAPQTVAKQPIAVLKHRSLPFSTVLTSSARRGRGSLQVANGTSSDAYLKLVNSVSSKLVAAFYVKSDSTFTLKGIPDGEYQVLFVSGEDWDAKNRIFTRNTSFTLFDRSLNFVTNSRTNRRGIYTRYTRYKLTLNPIVGGNATTSAIDEQQFANY